jgi:hypothetical protein
MDQQQERSPTLREPTATDVGSRRRLLLVVALAVVVVALVWGGLLLRGGSGSGSSPDVVVADVLPPGESPTSASSPVATTVAAPESTDAPAAPSTSVVGPVLPVLPAAPAQPVETTTTVWAPTIKVCPVPAVGSPWSIWSQEPYLSRPCRTASGVTFGLVNDLSPPGSGGGGPESAPDFIAMAAAGDVIVGWATRADALAPRSPGQPARVTLYGSDLTTVIGTNVYDGSDWHVES